MSQVRVLHIIQYLSLGGAARAMIAAAKYMSRAQDMQHDVISLLPPEDKAVRFAESEGMKFISTASLGDVKSLIPKYDLVQLQWWNNAEMNSLLHESLPACRLVAWCHVGGHTAPQVIPAELVQTVDYIIGCSPHTYNCPAIQALPADQRSAKAAMAYGAADFERVQEITPVAHAGFNVGYIGTVHFSKMHPDFVSMSAAIEIPEVKFIICGAGGQQQLVAEQIRAIGAEQRFDLRGYVDDIRAVIAELDVYGYPLCQDNYSGSEVNLQEIMYAGVPPVVFPYGGVKYLVVNNFTGFVVQSSAEYKQAIEFLYHQPDERARLGRNAAEYARQIFGAENAARVIQGVYQKALEEPKRAHTWGKSCFTSIISARLSCQEVFLQEKSVNGHELFIEALAGQLDCFEGSVSKSDTTRLLQVDQDIANCSELIQETVSIQYLRCFPNDAVLHFWSGIIQRSNGCYQEALLEFQRSAGLGFSHWRLLWYMLHCAEELGVTEIAQQARAALQQTLPADSQVEEHASKYCLPVL